MCSIYINDLDSYPLWSVSSMLLIASLALTPLLWITATECVWTRIFGPQVDFRRSVSFQRMLPFIVGVSSRSVKIGIGVCFHQTGIDTEHRFKIKLAFISFRAVSWVNGSVYILRIICQITFGLYVWNGISEYQNTSIWLSIHCFGSARQC